MNRLEINYLVKFIVNRYKDVLKIVEVGIGKYLDVALEIKKRLPEINLIVTDIRPDSVEYAKKVLNAYLDDVTKPNLQLYRNTSLIYSIRPPPELYRYLVKLSRIVNCDLLIRPLTVDEDIPQFRGNILNLGRGASKVYFIER